MGTMEINPKNKNMISYGHNKKIFVGREVV